MQLTSISFLAAASLLASHAAAQANLVPPPACLVSFSKDFELCLHSSITSGLLIEVFSTIVSSPTAIALCALPQELARYRAASTARVGSRTLLVRVSLVCVKERFLLRFALRQFYFACTSLTVELPRLMTDCRRGSLLRFYLQRRRIPRLCHDADGVCRYSAYQLRYDYAAKMHEEGMIGRTPSVWP